MNKFWILALAGCWLLAQSACADRLDSGANPGGDNHAFNNGRSGDDSRDNVEHTSNRDKTENHASKNYKPQNNGAGSSQGIGGQRSYHHHNTSSIGGTNSRAYNPGRGNDSAGHRTFHVNRAKTDAYSPSHFSYVRSAHAAVPTRFKNMGIHSVPQPWTRRDQYVTSNRGHSTISLPRTGPNGLVLSTHVMIRTQIGSTVVQHHMASLGANTLEMNRINGYNRTETRVNYYYWHSYNGQNYCHYYDPWGYHWYGWYVGDSCFWTRYYWGNWWWYDSSYSRWCYWHDGGWWWNDPANTTTVYVYENGDYNAVNTDTSADSAPADSAAAPGNPTISTAPIAQKGSYKSPDGTCLVKIFGDSNDAILSDTADPPKFKAVFLGSNAKSVKFNAASDGSNQVTVTFTDGSVKNFDEQGVDLDSEDDDQPDSSSPSTAAGNNT